MKKILILLVTHGAAVFAGFAAGIFALPILTAPEAPAAEEVAALAANAEYRTEFTRDLAGSDFLHWGEGEVTVSSDYVTLQGSLSPGPDYKLYFSPVFVEDEASFEANRASMVQAGSVKTFENFMLAVPDSIDPAQFTTVIVWCESFGEFITAAAYR